MATPGAAGSCQGWIEVQQLCLIKPITIKGQELENRGRRKERGHGEESGVENNWERMILHGLQLPKTLPESL